MKKNINNHIISFTFYLTEKKKHFCRWTSSLPPCHQLDATGIKKEKFAPRLYLLRPPDHSQIKTTKKKKDLIFLQSSLKPVTLYGGCNLTRRHYHLMTFKPDLGQKKARAYATCNLLLFIKLFYHRTVECLVNQLL